MNVKKIIDGLYFTVGMILFNPFTRESKTSDQLNEDDRITYDICMGVIKALNAQEPVEANFEHQCNKCKFYEGVHNVIGHAPCSLWEISGVMWNDYCSRFNLWKESEVE